MNFLVNPVFWGHLLRVYLYIHTHTCTDAGGGGDKSAIWNADQHFSLTGGGMDQLKHT